MGISGPTCTQLPEFRYCIVVSARISLTTTTWHWSIPLLYLPFFEFRNAAFSSLVFKGAVLGPGDILPGVRNILGSDSTACDILLDIAQKCGEEASIPDIWRRSNVVLLLKKGIAALPADYMPIALLPVGYKIWGSSSTSTTCAGRTRTLVTIVKVWV